MQACTSSIVGSGPQAAAMRLTMERLMAMPMTLPGLVVKNAEAISSIFSVGNPSRITARELELTLLASRLHQELAAESSMASMALSMRFINPCCRCTRSAMISGRLAASSLPTATEMLRESQKRAGKSRISKRPGTHWGHNFSVAPSSAIPGALGSSRSILQLIHVHQCLGVVENGC
jgi:hypothetical protein